MNGFMCYIPTRFFFGAGCLEKLGEQKLPGKMALLVTSNGITPDEFEKMAVNAKETMGGLFLNDPAPLSVEDCVKIYQKSYK